MKRNISLLALMIAGGFTFAGFSAETNKTQKGDATFASPSALKATVTDHSNVDLRWKNNATAPSGAWVEFTTPGDDFVKLDAVWPDTTTYRHPDVAPETTLIY